MRLGELKPGTHATLPDGRRVLVTGKIAGATLVRFGDELARQGPLALDAALEVEDVETATYAKHTAQAVGDVDPLAFAGGPQDAGLDLWGARDRSET